MQCRRFGLAVGFVLVAMSIIGCSGAESATDEQKIEQTLRAVTEAEDISARRPFMCAAIREIFDAASPIPTLPADVSLPPEFQVEQDTLKAELDALYSALPAVPETIELTKIAKIEIRGDTATAEVTTVSAGMESTGEVSLRREGDEWKLCSDDLAP
ncbi:hypothetical protein Ntsu_41890 [Nocardia sp. IFM 10818]